MAQGSTVNERERREAEVLAEHGVSGIAYSDPTHEGCETAPEGALYGSHQSQPRTEDSMIDPDDTRAARHNLHRLDVLVHEHRGDVEAAVREFTGLSSRQLAEWLGHPRRSVRGCLAVTDGRPYTALRRLIETELDIPAYSLDGLLAKRRK
jgi:hypothetical protein